MLASPQQASRPRSERGASAVEFALVLPLLMMFLLGVIQYGFGLYQLQSFTSVVNDASKLAGNGIDSCPDFQNQVKELGARNGLGDNSISGIKVGWLSRPDITSGDFSSSANAVRGTGLAQVTATFRPFRIGAPFVPFPSQITRTQSAPVMNTGLLSGVC